MSRRVAEYRRVPHGRTLMAAEPLVFHCNFYNYWLQKTLLLDESLQMEQVIRDAATEVGHALLCSAAEELQIRERAQRIELAQAVFAELGFGTADFSQLAASGGRALFPVSHYGGGLRQAIDADFDVPQSLFDAGYAAAAAAFVEQAPLEHFEGVIEACQSRGAKVGLVSVRRRTAGRVFSSPGLRHHGHGQPSALASAVDEPAILSALAQLDLSGNEEGLIPRFGVMLTNHFANFYNRISFEFVRRMAHAGMVDAAEVLLVDAGYRCAFHTLGGIMCSAEWDAVIRPQLSARLDWVHGAVAVVNALGWGTWRVAELSEQHLVVRIWDDYESCGHLDMYGAAVQPVSYLAAAAVAGIMNLIFVGDIAQRPELSLDFYDHCFESEANFRAEQTRSAAQGDAFTEVVATRSGA